MQKNKSSLNLPTTVEQKTSSNNNNTNSIEDYLEKYNVTTYFKDCITLLIENRPEDPITFISDYFKNVVKGINPTMRSYRYIKLTPKNRTAFIDNLVSAYHTLQGKPITTDDSQTNSSTQLTFGISYTEMKKLIEMTCIDFPPEVFTILLQCLSKGDNDFVSFEEFVLTIYTILSYEEWIVQLKNLFDQMDVNKSNSIPKREWIQLLVEYERETKEEETLHAVIQFWNQHYVKEENINFAQVFQSLVSLTGLQSPFIDSKLNS